MCHNVRNIGKGNLNESNTALLNKIITQLVPIQNAMYTHAADAAMIATCTV